MCHPKTAFVFIAVPSQNYLLDFPGLLNQFWIGPTNHWIYSALSQRWTEFL